MIIDYVSERRVKYSIKVACPADMMQALGPFRKKRQEHMLVATLDSSNSVIHVHILSIGLVARTSIHPREVFKLAIQDMASSIILIHNHPSGQLAPSSEDLECTSKIKEAGLLLGIPLLDHLIITRKSFLSLAEMGKL